MGMLTRRERDEKAKRTDMAAGAIIDQERNASEAKTARLRALRQGIAVDDAPMPKRLGKARSAE